MTAIVKVPFHGDELIAVETPEGVFVAVKPICERLGIDWRSQLRKISGAKTVWGMVILYVPSAGGEQETACLPVNRVAAFLFSIHPKKVRSELRDALIRYQVEAADVLDRHFRLKEAAHGEQLAASHTFLLAANSRWAKMATLIKGGASQRMVWKRSGLSWPLFHDELNAMIRCGLVSADDWYQGAPRTPLEEIGQLNLELHLERASRSQGDPAGSLPPEG